MAKKKKIVIVKYTCKDCKEIQPAQNQNNTGADGLPICAYCPHEGRDVLLKHHWCSNFKWRGQSVFIEPSD